MYIVNQQLCSVDGNRQEVTLDVYVSPCFSRFYDVLTSAQRKHKAANIDSYLLARSTRASRRHARGARGHQCTSLSQLIQQRYYYTTATSRLLLLSIYRSFEEQNFSAGCKAATAPSLAAIQFWSFWKLRSYVKTRPALGI